MSRRLPALRFTEGRSRVAAWDATRRLRELIRHDRANAFAPAHKVEPFVDLFEGQHVGDQIIDVDLAIHVPVDDPRHVSAPARAAERGAHPDAAGHELERTGRNLLPAAGHADDDRFAPAAM